MGKKLYFLVLVFGFSCTNVDKPLTEAEKVQIIGEAKEVINTIFQAAESIDSVKMTSTFFDSPYFISFINGDYANYIQTVKKYPALMGEFKTQKATILEEKYNEWMLRQLFIHQNQNGYASLKMIALQFMIIVVYNLYLKNQIIPGRY